MTNGDRAIPGLPMKAREFRTSSLEPFGRGALHLHHDIDERVIFAQTEQYVDMIAPGVAGEHRRIEFAQYGRGIGAQRRADRFSERGFGVTCTETQVNEAFDD